MKLSRILKASFMGLWLAIGMSVFAADDKPADPNAGKPRKAAIFVVNHAGQGFDNLLGTLNDLVANRVTEKGLSIIDKKEVAKPMVESREDAEREKEAKRQLAELNIAKQKREEDFLAGIKDDMDSASALRMAQQIGADYILVVTVTSFGQQTKKMEVLGQNVDISEYTLRIGLKVLEGNAGGSVYGDVVKASAKVNNAIGGDNTELINSLLDDAAKQIATNIGTRMKNLPALEKVPDMTFQINCNVENADVLVDGAVIGSCGKKLNAKPGLHAITVRREWFRDWRRNVNVQTGMVLDAELELSELGMKKYLELKAYEQEAERHQLAMDDKRAALADRTKANEIQRESDRAAIADRVKANEVEREADRAAIVDRAKLSESMAYAIKKAGDAEVERAKRKKSLIHIGPSLEL
jgi:hypothetical protein